MTAKSAKPRRWLLLAGAVLAVLLAVLAIGESLGWPFLAEPLQRLLSEKLNRRVSFSTAAESGAPKEKEAKPFSIRFIGGLTIHAPQLDIAAPAWSAAPHMLSGSDVTLALRYRDLWRAYRDQPLRVHRLQAAKLDGNLERLADGRASWQFGKNHTPLPPTSDTASFKQMPSFGRLQVADGLISYNDVPLTADVDIRLSLANGASVVETRPLSTDNSVAVSGDPSNVLQVNATGRYRDLPLKIDLRSTDVLPWTSGDEAAVSVPLTLNVTAGRASLVFKGTATDASHLGGFTGRFTVKGPSLAAVGDPLGVTLPTTSAFRTDGAIVRRGDTWYVVIDDATVGASKLNGAFTYEAARSTPLLSGRLSGARLLLTDLGPTIGVTPVAASKKGMVLPDRPFDLKALRSMDANVLIDMGELDLNSRLLEPLRPLHTHLRVSGGVLTLSDLDARTGQGELKGDVALDGRKDNAIWNVNLRWAGVQLERWIKQARANNAPPFISGRLSGTTKLEGRGKSTAEILGSLKGKFRTELGGGAISHLGVELAGIDVAESLGVFFKGDDALPVQCAVADLVAEGGTFRPRVMVVDTDDSAIWLDGSLSLATEALDLKATVMPKDFSLLTLRTPLRVRGTFGDPQVSIDKGPLGRTLASAFLLALLNPIAALIPLVDTGDAEAAKRGAAGCRSVTQRAAGLAAANPAATPASRKK